MKISAQSTVTGYFSNERGALSHCTKPEKRQTVNKVAKMRVLVLGLLFAAFNNISTIGGVLIDSGVTM